jgi:hypothetical protein
MPLTPRYRFDLDLAFMQAGLREIVGHLKAQPRVRTAAKSLVETERHIG